MFSCIQGSYLAFHQQAPFKILHFPSLSSEIDIFVCFDICDLYSSEMRKFKVEWNFGQQDL